MAKKKTTKTGRPTKMTAETVKKLEEAFALGCTDEEACIYADITKQTLYNYQDKNKGFIDRKELLKKKPVLKARAIIMKELKNENHDTAKWYLERKAKDEFSTRQESTGVDGQPIQIVVASKDDAKLIDKI